MLTQHTSSTLALTTPRSNVCLCRGGPVIWFSLLVGVFNLFSLEDSDVTIAALLAPAVLPPVLAEAVSAAVLALAAVPPVLADAATTALLADAAPPPVLAEAAAAAIFAPAALPAVRAAHLVSWPQS